MLVIGSQSRVILYRNKKCISNRYLKKYSSAPSSDLNLSRNQDDAEKLIKDKFSKVRQKYAAPRFPIVLCHGFSGFDTISLLPSGAASLFNWNVDPKARIQHSLGHLNYWVGIKEGLSKIGANVLTARVPPYASIRERAKHLSQFLRTESPNFSNDNGKAKFNLIAHSMGGLDCRYLISKLKHEEYEIKTLTTISTPHRGSECADYIVRTLESNNLTKDLIPESLRDLTTLHAKEFNEKIKDSPNVSYFSYGARFTPHWYNVFGPTSQIIKSEIWKNNKGAKRLDQLNMDNDGLVSVESAKWGKYLGTLDGVDHLDLINWTNRIRTGIDGIFGKRSTNFNALALYLDIAENLAKKGF